MNIICLHLFPCDGIVNQNHFTWKKSRNKNSLWQLFCRYIFSDKLGKKRCSVKFSFGIVNLAFLAGTSLTRFFPKFPFDPPETIRKPLVFWYLQADQKGTLGKKGLYILDSNCITSWEAETHPRLTQTSKMVRFATIANRF